MWEKEEKLQDGGVQLETYSEFIQVDSIIVDEFVFLPKIQVSLTIGCDNGRQFVIQNCVIKLALLEILRGDKVYLVLEECGENKFGQVESGEARKDDFPNGR